MSYKTGQEDFWAGKFGTDYIDRNNSKRLLYSKMLMWGKIIKTTAGIQSIVEFGCNTGLNLEALKMLNPNFSLTGIEINQKAVEEVKKKDIAKIFHQSILENISNIQADLTFTAGVLIHINPDHLNNVYKNLVKISKRYIVIAEYYNPTPISVNYRGFQDKLFKRDFAGELIEQYKLKLLDYGFIYKHDKFAPQDDINWFLLEK